MIHRGAEQSSAWQITQRCLARLRLVNQFVHDLSSRGILFLLRHRDRLLGIASGFLTPVSAVRPGNCAVPSPINALTRVVLPPPVPPITRIFRWQFNIAPFNQLLPYFFRRINIAFRYDLLRAKLMGGLTDGSVITPEPFSFLLSAAR